MHTSRKDVSRVCEFTGAKAKRENNLDEEMSSKEKLVALHYWGDSMRGERDVLGYPSRSQIYDLMLYGTAPGRKGPLYVHADVIDTDRIISTLRDDLRRALYVEYVIGGSVAKRVKEYGKSQPTFYRKLEQAKQVFFRAAREENKLSNDA